MVAAVVSECIVDDLQIVQVCQNQHAAFPCGFLTAQHGICRTIEAAAVVHTSQFVRVGDQLQTAVGESCFLQIALQFLDQTRHLNGRADLRCYGIDLGEMVIVQFTDKQTVLLLVGEQRHHDKRIPPILRHIAVGNAGVNRNLLFRRLYPL